MYVFKVRLEKKAACRTKLPHCKTTPLYKDITALTLKRCSRTCSIYSRAPTGTMQQNKCTWEGTGAWERIPKCHEGPAQPHLRPSPSRRHLNPAWGQGLLCLWGLCVWGFVLRAVSLWCSWLGGGLAAALGVTQKLEGSAFLSCPPWGMSVLGEVDTHVQFPSKVTLPVLREHSCSYYSLMYKQHFTLVFLAKYMYLKVPQAMWKKQLLPFPGRLFSPHQAHR